MDRLSVWAFLFLIIICCFQLHAQDETAIRSIIREGEIKKLTKADALKAEAEKKVGEASRLNMESINVQSNMELDEKTRTKKATQLENQALALQVEASSLYEKCNEVKFSVYKQYIDEFWKENEGKESDYLNSKLLEEQASDHYFQAASYRIDAKKMEGYTQIEKLSEAENLENQAIQKQLMALSTYYSIADNSSPADNLPPVETETPVTSDEIVTPVPTEVAEVTEPAVPTIKQEPPVTNGGITINQSVIDSYNQYIASGTFNDTTLATGKIAGITSFDSDRLLQLWYEYVYGRNALEQDVSKDKESETAAEGNVSPEIAVNKMEEKNATEIGIVTDENKETIVPADENVVYRVQLAANRTELSQRALSKMYYGNKSVEMINENGWYKYSVGDFNSYEEASRFRKESGISNAFVIAYRKGTRFIQTKEKESISQETIFTPAGDQKLPGGLIFRIQVAASRIPMSVSQLKRIYAGNYPLEMISEEGWYKYQFMGVRLYSDALSIIRDVSSPGVFLVAYEEGVKIDLADAVKKNKDLEGLVKTRGRKGNLEEIEYHLQIAASRIAMPPSELSALYTGGEPVAVIYEDGWYKYHLKAGNSYDSATQLKQSCGIPSAFIVAYKRAAKINLIDAMRE